MCDVPVESPPAPKVLDFGICKILWETDNPIALTRDGCGLGTLGYMSREQRGNAAGVDARTDIYALGITMYQALSGRLPFAQDGCHADAGAPDAPHPPPLRALDPALPAALEAIVLRAMARDASDRYASVEALQEDLLRWQRGYALRQERRTQEAARRPSWPVLAGVAGAAAVLALHALDLERERTTRSTEAPEPPRCRAWADGARSAACSLNGWRRGADAARGSHRSGTTVVHRLRTAGEAARSALGPDREVRWALNAQRAGARAAARQRPVVATRWRRFYSSPARAASSSTTTTASSGQKAAIAPPTTRKARRSRKWSAFIGSSKTRAGSAARRASGIDATHRWWPARAMTRASWPWRAR